MDMSRQTSKERFYSQLLQKLRKKICSLVKNHPVEKRQHFQQMVLAQLEVSCNRMRVDPLLSPYAKVSCFLICTLMSKTFKTKEVVAS